MGGYVLVGGASRRFGRDKASVRIGGVPMAERVALSMEEAGLEVRFVGKRARWRETVIEAGPRHALSGVLAALEDAASAGLSRAVIAPCDLPWLPGEAFSRLLACEEAAVLVGDRVQPLCGVFPVAWTERARELLSAGGSASAFADEAARLDVPAGWLRNVNRVEDLADPEGTTR